MISPATRVRRPQSNGIVERLHRTLLDEHFRVEGRRTWFETLGEMQAVLDGYNFTALCLAGVVVGIVALAFFARRLQAERLAEAKADMRTDGANARATI